MQSSFRHLARSAVGHARVVEAFSQVLREGLEREERTMLLASERCVRDVRDTLGSDAREVSLIVMDEHARNPSRVTSMLYRFGATPSTRRALGASELVLHGRTAAASVELLLGECVLNSRFLQALPMTVACVVDAERSGPDGIQVLRRSHPEIHGVHHNHDFDEALATELHRSSLPPPPEHAGSLVVDARRLDDLRALVHSVATGGGLPPDRVEDLVLAANEAVANSLRHGGGRATVRAWLEAGALVCEVRDHGYVRDPMTGRLPPSPTGPGGRGLWLVHHLCDLVQLRSSERNGTTVRLFVDR